MMTIHNAMFDEIWYVYTSVENRIKRLMASRGYSEEKMPGASWQIRHPRTITGVLRRVCWTTTAGIEDIRKQIASFLGKED